MVNTINHIGAPDLPSESVFVPALSGLRSDRDALDHGPSSSRTAGLME